MGAHDCRAAQRRRRAVAGQPSRDFLHGAREDLEHRCALGDREVQDARLEAAGLQPERVEGGG